MILLLLWLLLFIVLFMNYDRVLCLLVAAMWQTLGAVPAYYVFYTIFNILCKEILNFCYKRYCLILNI